MEKFDLKEIIISITNRCNLKCKMCDIPLRNQEELRTDEWKQAIKDASFIGAQTVVFSGGEPLLRDDIFELISFAKAHKMNACLTSNGILINELAAKKLSQAGVNVVNVSIEGSKEGHDYLRGAGTFDKAIRALDNLRKHEVEATIATMVSGYNYRYLTNIIDLAKKYNATTVKFQPFSKIFLSSTCKNNEFFIPDKSLEGFNQIIEKVIHLCAQSGITTNPRRYLERMPFYLSKRNFSINEICGALFSTCPVNSQGDIYPCWILTGGDTLIGNVKKDRFQNLWGSQKHHSIIKRIRDKGCPGCMMSCYDDNFGRDSIGERTIMSITRLKKGGFYGYMCRILKRWQKRFKFYAAYRGSLKDIARRLKGILRKKEPLKVGMNEEKIKEALIEIEKIKQMLKKEKESLRCD